MRRLIFPQRRLEIDGLRWMPDGKRLIANGRDRIVFWRTDQ